MAILVASAAVWLGVIALIIVLFVNVFIPAIQFGGRAEIPSNFPVYPGATLQSAFASSIQNCTTVDATWMSRDSVSSVAAFYRTNLATGPWTLTDDEKSRYGDDLFFNSTSSPYSDGEVSIQTPPFSDSQTLFSLTLYKSGAHVSASCRLPQGAATP